MNARFMQFVLFALTLSFALPLAHAQPPRSLISRLPLAPTPKAEPTTCADLSGKYEGKCRISFPGVGSSTEKSSELIQQEGCKSITLTDKDGGSESHLLGSFTADDSAPVDGVKSAGFSGAFVGTEGKSILFKGNYGLTLDKGGSALMSLDRSISIHHGKLRDRTVLSFDAVDGSKPVQAIVDCTYTK